MKKPLALRLAPPRIRQSITYRVYLNQCFRFRSLYSVARLALCPSVSMYNLVPGDIISGNIAFNGFYELDLSREIMRSSRKGGLLVDVGANMGYFSLLWAGMNPLNRVIAFEPAARNIERMSQNIERNGLSDRISLIPKAVGHKAGTVWFNAGSVDQTGWGGITLGNSGGDVEVPIVRLDEELRDTRIDILKIDVEGADTWVLYGCEALLRQNKIRKRFFEQNAARMRELGIGANEAKDFLADLGYVCAPFGRGGGEWVAEPQKSRPGLQDLESM